MGSSDFGNVRKSYAHPLRCKRNARQDWFAISLFCMVEVRTTIPESRKDPTMATTALKGNPVHTSGDLPAVGSKAPAYALVGQDLSAVESSSFAGKSIVLNIFPSIDTGVCATSVRKFN